MHKLLRGLMGRGQLYHSYWVELEDGEGCFSWFRMVYLVLRFGDKLHTLDTSGISKVAPWSQLLRWSLHVRNYQVLKEIRFSPLHRHLGFLVHFPMMSDVLCVLCFVRWKVVDFFSKRRGNIISVRNLITGWNRVLGVRRNTDRLTYWSHTFSRTIAGR